MNCSPRSFRYRLHAPGSEADLALMPSSRAGTSQPSRRPAVGLEVQTHRSNRAAPYSRDILSALAQGKQPNVFIYTGPHAWERAKARHRPLLGLYATLLPKDVAPEDLLWPPARTPLVIAEGIPRQDAVRLGAALIASGCVAALVICEGELLTFRASRDVQGD